MCKIKTEKLKPTRSHDYDYMAWFDGYKDSPIRGYGASEAEAISAHNDCLIAFGGVL